MYRNCILNQVHLKLHAEREDVKLPTVCSGAQSDQGQCVHALRTTWIVASMEFIPAGRDVMLARLTHTPIDPNERTHTHTPKCLQRHPSVQLNNREQVDRQAGGLFAYYVMNERRAHVGQKELGSWIRSLFPYAHTEGRMTDRPTATAHKVARVYAIGPYFLTRSGAMEVQSSAVD